MNKTAILTRLEVVKSEAKLLRNLLTKKDGPITDRIKTWDDVCDELSLDKATILPYSSPSTEDEKAINAFAQLNYIRQALNEGWVPNWDDENEYKYYPWFDMRGSAGGSGFSDSYFNYSYYDNSFVGSRLCYKSRELATYAAKQFEKVYKALFIIK